jgi:N utilization substance protein B
MIVPHQESEDLMEFLARAKFRELIFLFLYSLDISDDQEIDHLIDTLADQVKVSKKHLKEAAKVVGDVLTLKKEIDGLIAQTSTEYAVDRILSLEMNILRLAVYEIMKQLAPHPVVISEAIRLARKFSTPESGKFINAVLDHFSKGLLVAH